MRSGMPAALSKLTRQGTGGSKRRGRVSRMWVLPAPTAALLQMFPRQAARTFMSASLHMREAAG